MFLIVCFHFSRRLLDRRRHKTNKGRTNRRSLPNCQQNGRIAARHGRLAFRDRAFWQKEGRSAARQRRHTGRWHGGRSAARMNRRRKGGAAAEEGKFRPRARGRSGDAGVPAATRVYRRRKGGAAAERGKLRPMARGRPTGRQRRSSGCERKAGRRNVRGGAPAVGTGAGRQGDRGGTPAAGTRRVGGTAEEVRAAEEEFRLRAQGGSAERRRRCGRRRSTGRWHAGQRHKKKGLRCRRPVSGGPDYIYYRFCSPRIRIATSRIVVSSNVTTPPSGPGSK